jgi:hypothetical protein
MAKNAKLELVPLLNGKGCQWEVMLNGTLVGMLERATITIHGEGPEYLAHYFKGRELKLYPSAFHGELAAVNAVALIMERTR